MKSWNALVERLIAARNLDERCAILREPVPLAVLLDLRRYLGDRIASCEAESEVLKTERLAVRTA